jgi:hypothetical protein
LWDWITCFVAAKGGYLDYLKYAHEKLFFLIYHENGCQWNKYTCFFAKQYNNKLCFDYPHRNSYPDYEGT